VCIHSCFAVEPQTARLCHIRTGTRPTRCHICTGTGPTRCHICAGTGPARGHLCTGTGLAAATSAPGLGSPPPHLHRDWAHRRHICTGTGLARCHICTGTGLTLPHLHRDCSCLRPRRDRPSDRRLYKPVPRDDRRGRLSVLIPGTLHSAAWWLRTVGSALRVAHPRTSRH
jgi:hypothetical protein